MKRIILPLFFLSLYFFVGCGDEEQSSEAVSSSAPAQTKKATSNFPDDVRFIGNTEKVVETGDVFNLTYTLNHKHSNFELPDMEGVSILGGPYLSKYTTVENINGHQKRNLSISYTYSISCDSPGEYKISPASAEIQGKTVTSNELTIKVIGGEKNSSGNQPQTNSAKHSKKTTAAKDIFVETEYSKQKTYKGEALVATTKIFTRVDIHNLKILQYPDYKDFQVEVLEAPDRYIFSKEMRNGKIYHTALIKKELLFSRKPGKFTLKPVKMVVEIKKINGKTRNLFGEVVDAYTLEQKILTEKKQTLLVMPLPSGDKSPDNFSGITATDVSLSAALSDNRMDTQGSATLRLTLSGCGNMYLLSALPLSLPKSLKSFAPEIEKSDSLTEKGMCSKHQFTYIIVAENPGDYTIPPIQFVYFNPRTATYETAQSEPVQISVNQGSKSANNSPDMPNISDHSIRFIKKSLNETNVRFYSSLYFYLIFPALIVCFLILLQAQKIIRSKQADTAGNRKKNAGKASQRRLKQSLQYKQSGDTEAFYKEILSCLQTYLSDKTAAGKEHFTRKGVETLLAEKQANPQEIADFLDIMEVCSYAQYAGSAANTESTMQADQIYKRTESLLDKLEEQLN